MTNDIITCAVSGVCEQLGDVIVFNPLLYNFHMNENTSKKSQFN